jgi:hypothetical protein
MQCIWNSHLRLGYFSNKKTIKETTLTLTLTATTGAALANLAGSGADIYNIPPGSTIVITTQRGFGDVTETAGADSNLNSILAGFGLA